MTNLPLSELINLCITHNNQAWCEFTRRYQNLIWWVIHSKASGLGEEVKKDLFQDIFRILLDKNRLMQIKNRNNITSWLVMVSYNVIRAYYNKSSRIAFTDEQPSGSYTEKELLNNDITASFEKNISEFPIKDQAIMKLYFIHHKKYREIAQILRLPANTVASTIRRKRKILQKNMQEFRDV